MPLSPRVRNGLKFVGIGAAFSMAALSPLQLSSAAPEDENTPAPVTVTATVTANVAPDQCDPVPDGKLPQNAVDYATGGQDITPVPSLHPAPPEATEVSNSDTLERMSGPWAPAPLAPGSTVSDEDEESDTRSADELTDAPRESDSGELIEGTGPFDPYLCVATTDAPETTTITPSTEPTRALEDIPGAKPSELPDYGAREGAGESGAGVSISAPDEDDRPTTTTTQPGTLPR